MEWQQTIFADRMITNKNKVTVAIGDDHPRVRQVIKLCLDMVGYPVILEAENGQALIEKLDEAQLPDICMLDLNMPAMDGYETTLHLKRYWPSVKVLIYSMNQDIRSKEKAFACGADGYLVKPSTIDEIEVAIEKIVQLA